MFIWVWILSFIKGLIVGAFWNLPIGPLTIYALEKTFSSHPKSGRDFGYGIVLADSAYALLSILGISNIFEFLPFNIENNFVFDLIVGVIVLLYGIYVVYKNLNPKMRMHEHNTPEKSTSSGIRNGFFITLTNPSTLFIFLVIAHIFKIDSSIMSELMFLAGIVIAGITYWRLLYKYAKIIMSYHSENLTKKISIGCGCFLIAIALFELLTDHI